MLTLFILPILSFLNLVINCFLNKEKNTKLCENIFISFSLIEFILTFFYINNQFFEYTLKIKSIPMLHLSNANFTNIFVLLTSFIALLVSIDVKTSIKNKNQQYINMLLLTNIALFMCFLSKDLISFYIFFELSIIPIFFVILLWGGVNKILAAKQFLIYTVFGSAFILVPIIYLCNKTGTAVSVDILKSNNFIDLSSNVKITLCSMMILGFFIKIPTFPFHTWLPLAHVQAPTGGSMILAGILIKLGGFGILQYVLPIFSNEILILQNYLIVIGLISLIYGSFVAMGQTDIKKMIAYSSIAHMSYVVCGLCSMNINGINGAVFQMISHGVISCGLFYAIGILYTRFHTRDIEKYGNLYEICPFYAKIFILLSMASVGLPGTIGFIGELMTILSIVSVSKIYALILAFGAVIGAIYILNLCRKLLFTKECNTKIQENDFILTIWEKCNLCIISTVIILGGIYPKFIFNIIKL